MNWMWRVELGDTGKANTNLSMFRFPSSASDWVTLVLSSVFGPGATVESLAPAAAVTMASSADFLPSVGATSADGAEINALIWEKNKQTNSKHVNGQTSRGQRIVVESTSQGSDFTVHKQETAGFRLTHSGWSGGGLGITSSTAGCTHRNKNDSRTNDQE